jgi:hypothetical protein
LTLEFTRLSQLTGEPKYYDAVQRITNLLDSHQNRTNLPGLFPILLSPQREEFDGDTFTFGGMSDSMYEYFPKQYQLLGGRSNQYRRLYEGAIETAKKNLFFRPMIPQNQNILISGTVRTTTLGTVKLDPEGQHLACFAGGMVALGAKIFNRTDDLAIAVNWSMAASGPTTRCQRASCLRLSRQYHAIARKTALGARIDGMLLSKRFIPVMPQKTLMRAISSKKVACSLASPASTIPASCYGMVNPASLMQGRC